VGGEQWADEQGSTEHAQHVLTRPGGLSAKIAADGVPSDARLPIARCLLPTSGQRGNLSAQARDSARGSVAVQHAFGGCLADFLHRHPEIRLRRWGILASDGFAHFANVSSDPGPDGAILFPLLEILPIPLHRGRMTYGQSRSSFVEPQTPTMRVPVGQFTARACSVRGVRHIWGEGAVALRGAVQLSSPASLAGADEGEGTCLTDGCVNPASERERPGR